MYYLSTTKMQFDRCDNEDNSEWYWLLKEKIYSGESKRNVMMNENFDKKKFHPIKENLPANQWMALLKTAPLHKNRNI